MKLRLITKITIITSLVLLTVTGFFAYVAVSTLKRYSYEEVIKDAETLSETVLRTTHHLMLDNNREGLAQVINDVSRQKGIEGIRLFNKEGVINFSNLSSEVGTVVDKNAEGCNTCHFGKTPLTDAPSMSRSRVYKMSNGTNILAMTKEIPNQKSCSSAECHYHPADAELIGILDIHFSLDQMQMPSVSFRNEIFVFTFFLIFILSVSLTQLTQKLVIEPVNRLLQHTKKVASGHFEDRIEGIPNDELGELEEAFNEMTRRLKNAHDELKGWGGALEAKVEERTREIQDIQSKLMRSEKLAALGELVAGIAHEINNPLTSIMIYSSIVMKNPALDPALRSDLETVLRQTQRCAEIVGRLLDFGRETTPRKKLESVNDVLERTLILLERQASFHDIKIVRKFKDDLPEVMIDPSQLKQVFMNLFINASQAMPYGGVLTLSSCLDEETGMLSVKVADTGCGISEEAIEKIFDPFFTTKEHEGTGLGLSVSYGILENHGGRIEVESRLGEGTVFTVLLPLDYDIDSGSDSKEITPRG